MALCKSAVGSSSLSIFPRNKGILHTSLRRRNHAESESIVRNRSSEFLVRPLRPSVSPIKFTLPVVHRRSNRIRAASCGYVHLVQSCSRPFVKLPRSPFAMLQKFTIEILRVFASCSENGSLLSRNSNPLSKPLLKLL